MLGAWAMACIVELRGTADAHLREVVREGVPLLVRALAREERELPRFVLREFDAYLGCRDPAKGFAWLECSDCDHHRLVLFSCKTRGFCPSCAGRRMAEKAAHWVDRVIPWVATRQWVLTVPFKRRWLLARRADLVDGILRVALRQITKWYRKATGRPRGKSGAVTSIQRFGSALNLNVHFHIIHLDGVYDRGADEALRFFQATPRDEDIEALAVNIAAACERWLSLRGFSGQSDDEDPDAGEMDAQALLQLASLMGLTATGERAGKRARRTQRLGGREVQLGPRCAAFEGYELVCKTRCERVVLGDRPRGAGAAVSLRPATTARTGSPREAPRRASAAGAEAGVVGRDDGDRAFRPGVRREARCDHPAAAGKPDALRGRAGGQRGVAR